ncbi:MAG TPA: hypothetical protein PK156_14085 [Polyangium sp.]|nr:hypothetical protein [Polyangium sp.]
MTRLAESRDPSKLESAMPVIHIEAQISAEELVAAAGQLGLTDIDQLVDKLLALRAQRRAPSLSAEESALLEQINKGIPEVMRDRYEALVERRRANELSDEERAELYELTDSIEMADAERLTHLTRLARVRGVGLDVLLKDLGIQSPRYV